MNRDIAKKGMAKKGMQQKWEKGKEAEIMAQHHLEKQGYQILTANYRTRGSEIDLVVFKDAILVFVEVRYRKDGPVRPIETIQFKKQRRILKGVKQILNCLDLKKLGVREMRIDVVEVSAKELVHWKNCILLV